MADLNLKKLVDKDILKLVLELFKENYDQNVSNRGYLTTSQVQALIDAGGFQNEGEVKDLITAGITEWVADAPQSFDTLKEIGEWIQNHGDVSTILDLIDAKIDEAELAEALADYVKTEDLNTTLNDYATKTEIADTYVTKVQLNALEMTQEEAEAIVNEVFNPIGG